MECVFCGKKVPVEGKIGRRDTCPHCQRDLRCCKGQVGRVPGAAVVLALPALAIVHDDGFARHFIADGAAGAAAGIDLAHGAYSNVSKIVPRRRSTLPQPSLILRKAVSLVGMTKPECTSRRRVPFSACERNQVTMVSRREP